MVRPLFLTLYLLSCAFLSPMGTTFAQEVDSSMDVDPPMLVNMPQTEGVRAQKNRITAFLSDASDIASVKIRVILGDKSAIGDMPKDGNSGSVSARIRAPMTLKLQDQPTWFGQSIGSVEAGTEMEIIGTEGAFFKVTSPEGLTGYVDASEAEVISHASAYTLPLPARVCDRTSLSYQIIAMDVYGNTTETEVYTLAFKGRAMAARQQNRSASNPRTGGGSSFSLDGDFSILVQAGTMGGGGGLGYRFNPNWSVRLSGNYFKYGMSGTYEDIDEPVAYDVNLSLQSFSLLMDYYPGGRGFHLTGGMIYNKNLIDGKGIPADDITVEGTTYTPAEVGELRMAVQGGSRWTPYLGLGLGSPAPATGMGFFLDLGVLYMGSPDVNLDADQGTMIYPTTENEAQIEQNIENLKWYVVVSLGLSFAL